MPRDAVWRGEVVRTGIFKSAVPGPVGLRDHNLDGDRQADLSVHGGADKAVYGYPSEHYGYWCAWLGVDALPWGAFGENLTTEGLLETDVCIGDRFRIGSAELEVSQPRIPCSELAPGDPIERIASDPRGLSVAAVQSLKRGHSDPELIHCAAEHPALAEVWR